MTDVIILSNAKTRRLQRITQQAVDSCIATAKDINIIVIEQCKILYRNCSTHIFDHPFNYNRFANMGASITIGENIVISNNDVLFQTGWLDELLKANYPLVSPKCPLDKRQKNIIDNEIGFKAGRNFSGWCFMIKRPFWEQIGGFDEDFGFWCADNAVIEQCKAIGVTPMIVPTASVVHFGSTTLMTMPNRDELTRQQVIKFDKKYNQNLYSELYGKN